MLRAHCIAFAVALTVFAVSPFAMPTAKAKKPTITSSSATATDLTINGEDLAPGAPGVLLGSFGPLAVTGQTPNQLMVTLPGGLTPGNYVLSVQIGKGRGDVDESVVTIGAGGSQGPKGDQGLPGPAAPMQSGLQFRFTQPNGNGFESSASNWSRAGTFVYQGTSTEKVPTSFVALVYTTNAASYARVRIHDVTNGATIAMGPPSNLGTDATVAIADLGAISNLPTNPSVFEIQILSTNVTGQTGIAGVQSVGIHALQMY